MEWRGLNDLREQFLSFFESKGHTRMASSSLIPQGDKSLLLINSGMAPLKKYFLGQAVPPNVRVTTCQKCIRTPDIENVGKTARHGTYFEMLGNFSFGDYFKREAINWAWEFFTKVLELPIDKLHCSVFQDDDEAYDIWTKEIGVDPSHMVRMGREDNFWEHGSGPCGPCSEIYFDRGAEKGCGKPDCHVGCECDRFVEVWNLVFSQFDSDGNGTYTEMEHKNIDTGMGLERLACVMQGVDNLFEVDTVQNIMKHISRIANVHYHDNHDTDVSLRVITDHIRSTTFMVGDGVLPSNEGRGYVLRRLLRRAARHGRMIGIKGTFLHEVCDTVIDENKNAYPESEEKRAYIKKIIKVEEEAFAKTIDKGMELLNEVMDSAQTKTLSGADVFKLADTYGFPFDLTVEIAGERGFDVDEEGYRALVQKQRETAKADHAAKASSSWADNSIKLEVPKTNFVGYTENEVSAQIVAIVKEQEITETVNEGESAVIVLDKTPLYAESGGQASDHGKIYTDSGVFKVSAVTKDEDGHFLHFGKLESGILNVGNTVTAKYCKKFRSNVMRNHTSAHLLQAALRQVLGEHVHQAGQLVNDKACRFDFSHFSAMTTEEIQKVENLVNTWILEGIPVEVNEMPIDEARKLGAMALFGEKYDEEVRVVSIGKDENCVSKEFCAGTHARNTRDLRLFKIVSEGAISAGTRRIEVVVSSSALEFMNEKVKEFDKLSLMFKAHTDEVVERVDKLQEENRELNKKIEKLEEENSRAKFATFVSRAQDIMGGKLFISKIEDINPLAIKVGTEFLSQKLGESIIVLANNKTVVAKVSESFVKRGVQAGQIVGEIARATGANGGGRPNFAQGGIKDSSKLNEILAKIEQDIKTL